MPKKIVGAGANKFAMNAGALSKATTKLGGALGGGNALKSNLKKKPEAGS